MSHKEMTKEEKASIVDFYNAQTSEMLSAQIAQMETEKNGLGEMSESAQNGADWMRFGPSWQDCEIEIANIEKHLEIARPILKEKLCNDSENHTSKCDNTSECSDR